MTSRRVMGRARSDMAPIDARTGPRPRHRCGPGRSTPFDRARPCVSLGDDPPHERTGPCLPSDVSDQTGRGLLDGAVGAPGEPAPGVRVDRLLGGPRPAAELRLPVVGERLLDLVLAVHHERPVAGDRLADRVGPGAAAPRLPSALSSSTSTSERTTAPVLGADLGAVDRQAAALEEVERADRVRRRSPWASSTGRPARSACARSPRRPPDGWPTSAGGGGGGVSPASSPAITVTSTPSARERAGCRRPTASRSAARRACPRPGRLSQIWNSSSGFGCSASSSGNISEWTMPSPGGEPLHVAPAEAGGRAERVGVVDEALAHVGDGLEAAVRVVGEPGHVTAVVHPPAVEALEVLAELAPLERHRRPRHLVARRVGVVVVHAEQERIDGRPLEPQRHRLEHRVSHAATGYGRAAAAMHSTPTGRPPAHPGNLCWKRALTAHIQHRLAIVGGTVRA